MQRGQIAGREGPACGLTPSCVVLQAGLARSGAQARPQPKVCRAFTSMEVGPQHSAPHSPAGLERRPAAGQRLLPRCLVLQPSGPYGPTSLYLQQSRHITHRRPQSPFAAELKATAAYIAQTGKGILASDESNATTGKRLESVGVENTEDTRRAWRELLYTAPGLGQYISGAIMFEETLYQKARDGRQFVDILAGQGIYPGIKVDTGLQVRPPGLKGLPCLRAAGSGGRMCTLAAPRGPRRAACVR
jgi:hypothetical protein